MRSAIEADKYNTKKGMDLCWNKWMLLEPRPSEGWMVRTIIMAKLDIRTYMYLGIRRTKGRIIRRVYYGLSIFHIIAYLSIAKRPDVSR